MAIYAIYGKRYKEWVDYRGHTRKPDTKFHPLDYEGRRVSKKVNAGTYATKKDAKEVLETKVDPKCLEFTQFEIRRLK